MLRLSIEDIVQRIEKGDCFHAVAQDYSFTLKIKSYAPYFCGAVHNGHHFRSSLWEKCTHSEYERWYEEDPCTLQMVQHAPITIAGCDSRFEYDLNRAPETAIYEDAWGKTLWHQSLSFEEKENSLQKHKAFYIVVHALVTKLEQEFDHVLVIDMHSYNWKRWTREVPVWNLGTANIDNDRFGTLASQWSAMLGDIKLPNGIKNTSGINDTFQGNGYFLKYISANFKNTLVLATEISKVYCNELDGQIYPEVVHAVKTQFKQLIPQMVEAFEAEVK